MLDIEDEVFEEEYEYDDIFEDEEDEKDDVGDYSEDYEEDYDYDYDYDELSYIYNNLGELERQRKQEKDLENHIRAIAIKAREEIKDKATAIWRITEYREEQRIVGYECVRTWVGYYTYFEAPENKNEAVQYACSLFEVDEDYLEDLTRVY